MYVVIIQTDVKALHVHVHQSSNKSKSISAKQDVTNTEIDVETEPQLVIVCLVCSHLLDTTLYTITAGIFFLILAGGICTQRIT